MSDATIPRPTSDDQDQWKAYWTAQGEPWRTEPEISSERQEELARRRDTIKPHVEKGIYPFKDVRLTRADIEWLLHEHGPIDWNDESQREREGLDLRGCALKKRNEDFQFEQVDLSSLPLAKVQFGLVNTFSIGLSGELENAASDLQNCSLIGAHLQGAFLNGVHLERANLYASHLEDAFLLSTYLEEADIGKAYLTGAKVRGASMRKAKLSFAYLKDVDFQGAILEGADLSHAHIEYADFRWCSLSLTQFTSAHLQDISMGESKSEHVSFSFATLQDVRLDGSILRGAYFSEALLSNVSLSKCDLSNADFHKVHFEGGHLYSSDLSGANLSFSYLQGLNFSNTQLEGADFSFAHLEGANFQNAKMGTIQAGNKKKLTNLQGASFNASTQLAGIYLGAGKDSVKLADVSWNNGSFVNIAIAESAFVAITHLGDESDARLSHKEADWRTAVRAYRQTAIALRAQGMNEVADRFAYRAQLCQRRVTRFGGLRSLPAYLGSLLLDLISGYGYRPARSLATYALVIGVFALIYGLLGQSTHPLTFQESVVISMTAFHGRGFFATSFSPGDPQAIAAAIEAFVGLFIEVTFIATFTQRFFSR